MIVGEQAEDHSDKEEMKEEARGKIIFFCQSSADRGKIIFFCQSSADEEQRWRQRNTQNGRKM